MGVKAVLRIAQKICFCLFKDSEGGGGCPFCRSEIKGTEQVVVDPFSPEPDISGSNFQRTDSIGDLIDCSDGASSVIDPLMQNNNCTTLSEVERIKR